MVEVMSRSGRARVSEHPFLLVFLLGSAVHALMLVYDIQQAYAPFLQGDRSGSRFSMLQTVLADPTLATIANVGAVPGEYVFQLPFFMVAGIPGIILFQFTLNLLSVLCIMRIARSYFQTRRAVLLAGLAYLFLPQNLVFSHQFVTEAVATPFVVFALFFMDRYVSKPGPGKAAISALFLGLAILVRPSLALAAPILFVISVWFGLRGILLAWKAIAGIALASLAPLLLWVALFTHVMGHVGYTTGVASLDWNLRSKVFLVSTANNLPKPPEVAGFDSYASLYRDTGGISVRRFLTLVAESPVPYAKTFLTDASIVFGKANVTKLTVDYFSIARDQNIKGWRNVAESGGVIGLVNWAFSRLDMLLVFLIETLGSILTSLLSLIAMTVLVASLYKPSRMSIWREDQHRLTFLVFMTTMMAVVLLSAEIVDRAQARLRHPVDAMLLLMAGIMAGYLQYRNVMRSQVSHSKSVIS